LLRACQRGDAYQAICDGRDAENEAEPLPEEKQAGGKLVPGEKATAGRHTFLAPEASGNSLSALDVVK
jgi:hypothetical protein